MWEPVAGFTEHTVTAIVLAEGRALAATPHGVFRKEPGSAAWLPPDPEMPAPLAAGLAVAQGVAYAAGQQAIYRSTDGGQSWTPVLGGAAFTAVAAEDDMVVAASAGDGVFVSLDAGASWASAVSGLLDYEVLAVALPSGFASHAIGFAGTGSGLYVTRNGAASWRPVDLAEDDEVAVECLAASPSFAEDGIALAGTGAHGLFRSSDQGRSWSRVAALGAAGISAVAADRGRSLAAATGAEVHVCTDENHWIATARPGAAVLALAWDADGSLLAGLDGRGIARIVP